MALLLGLTVSDLKLLLELQPHNFKRWRLGQSERDRLAGMPKKKPRTIQQPKAVLHGVHKRVALLLGRIEKPQFVYSATKRRSYVDNALQHQNDLPCVKVDIKEFYPHVTFARVRRFFTEDLECADDIAHVLALLCCIDGALPTGSPVSPVLSYFACCRMFSEIANLATERDIRFTLYVDDMVFSGAPASRKFAEEVRRVLKCHGFTGHKITSYAPGEVKVITGVAVRDGYVDVPHGRRRRMRLTEEAFFRAKQESELRLLGAAVIGQFREAERICPGSKFNAARIQKRLDEAGIALDEAHKSRVLVPRRASKVLDELRARRAKVRAELRSGSVVSPSAQEFSEAAA